MRTHDTTTLVSPTARHGPTTGTPEKVGRFALHTLEMCAVMCVSLGLLGLLAAGSAAALGFSDPRQTAPALSAVVVTLTLAGSMVAWMRFRRMAWRPTLEMAGSSVLAGAAMISGYSLGIVAATSLIPGVCGLACAAMIGVMLFRFPLYASHTGHHEHAA